MAIRPVSDGGSRASASPAYERVPPHNVEAEESVLGSMLLSKDAIAEVLELLREDDFYRPAHRTVFRSVLELYGHGDAVDAVTVQEELRRNGALADVGGAPFLHTLVASVPTAANAAYYARIVKEAGVLRRLIDVGTQIVQLGFETPQDTERAVDIAESLVYQVAQGRVTEDYHSLHDVLTGTLEAIERLHEDHREITGVPTGFPDLDRVTSGLQASNLIIVAARPGVGKSTLGLDVARHASVRAGVPTVVFSLEMSRTELVQRLMCAECSVDMQRLRTGRMNDSDWNKLTRSLGKLADSPMFIDDSPGTTLMEIRAKCRRLKQRHQLGLVIVDYLQLMQPSKRFENRQQEVSELSRGLKLLAKELEVPVIAISQLSRQPESRSDKKPMLSDLRESGALEQDADVVLFIYRDDLYNPETSSHKGEADLILAKHRNGPTDTVTVTFQGQYSRFTPMAARSMQ
jgi:replicative DNA helicase